MPTFREDVKLGTKVPLIRGDDIAKGSVGWEHLSQILQSFLAKFRCDAISNDTIDKIVNNIHKPI